MMITTPKQNVPDRDDDDRKNKVLHHMPTEMAGILNQIWDLVDDPADREDIEEIILAQSDLRHAIELYEMGQLTPDRLLEAAREADILCIKIHRPSRPTEVRITTRRRANEIKETFLPSENTKTLDRSRIGWVEIVDLPKN